MKILHLARYTNDAIAVCRVFSDPRSAADFVREHMTPEQFAQCRSGLGRYAEGRCLALSGGHPEYTCSIEQVEADLGDA